MKYIVRMIIITFFMVLLTACNENSIEAMVTIKKSSNANNMEAIKELHLGTLYEYEYEWKQAKETWIKIWAEAYQDGEKVEPNLAELNYGREPNEDVVTEPLGFGIIETDDEDFIMLYTGSTKQGPKKITLEDFKNVTASAWDEAFQKELTMELGETKIIGAYRDTSNNTLRSGYNLQDEHDIKQMIETYDTVILFKMKVVEEIE
ncbi:hypothetical protein H8S33_00920 [Ornithinibacillus sp. BX22]|uniref:Uncharacterized protein n=1 Tax=Ornithinibacillus hominis TaxID=2763055 RepID=A0A923RFB5_9BACI|nr:hypothetical protein [Ornithinibacillus hominis]MBC5635374.1 hypothetical protein [Ornithinibacillus hominis]